MPDPTLRLRPINDLLSERFFIPAYQRGYRWTPRQVKDLLNDILTFHKGSDTQPKNVFYCLQPIVVMKRPGGEWEVIDGQQRLTTLFLILTYLKDLGRVFKKKRFTIDYETRTGSHEFLNNIDIARAEENIDYNHIVKALTAIQEWFAEHQDYEAPLFQCVTNPDEIGKNVKIIWYDLSETPATNPVEVFIRLNIGKIPLTNAELIRALFLQSSNFGPDNTEAEQLQIAQEWDLIEKNLQSDDFWYFLYEGDKDYATRIEYLFWLINTERPGSEQPTDDPYWTFLEYATYFEPRKRETHNTWNEDVKGHFMTCEEWFRDRVLYHLVGFLVAQGTTVTDLKRLASTQNSKTAFRKRLKERIYQSVFTGGRDHPQDQTVVATTIQQELAALTYGNDDSRRRIRAVLLLFNIATLLQNPKSTLRFPFDSYKKDDWDIEHIKAVKSDKPGRIDDQKSWLTNLLEYWTGDATQESPEVGPSKPTELIAKAKDTLTRPDFDTTEFDRLYDPILAYFGEDKESETDNGLANLALLDASTNRSYKNAVFPIKRRRIIGLDKCATFVPLCTTNVFLKYYSKRIDNMMFWTENDRRDYFDAIRDTLNNFFLADEKGCAE